MKVRIPHKTRILLHLLRDQVTCQKYKVHEYATPLQMQTRRRATILEVTCMQVVLRVSMKSMQHEGIEL